MSLKNRQAGWLKSRPFLLLLSFLLSVLLLTSWQVRLSSASDENELPFPVVVLPEEAQFAPLLPAREQDGLRKGQAKMDGALAQLADQSAQSTEGGLEFGLNSDLRIVNEKVQVRVISAAEQLRAAEKAVTGAGGEVTYVSELAPEMQAWIPVSELESVAADTAVAYLSQPAYLVPLDVNDTNATSEGLAALASEDWHNAGQRGGGVKIAIIDGGFLGYPGLLGSDLPASVTAKNFVDGESDDKVNGGSVHGTACAEIVYDIAPDAQFYLIKVATNHDLQEAVNYAISQGVDVISTSIGWYNLTPGDGTGEFADLAALARSSGIIWATAAGNDGDAHWGGPFYDPDPNDSDNSHYFDDGQNVNWFGPGNGAAYVIPSDVLLRVYVRWDDWAVVDQDYDLLVVAYIDGSWQIVGRSERWQDGQPGRKPTEDVIGVTTGEAKPYGFVIERYDSSRDVNLEIFAPGVTRLDEIVPGRSLANLADAPAVVTVGAVGAVSPYAFQEYSAQGPTNGPGGSLNGGFMKPDLAAYTWVSTESYGAGKFGGTSAAAPHVAGAAALVKGVYPLYSPPQIQDLLQNRAVDMGAPGMDTIYGYGRAFLGSNTPPTFTSDPVIKPIAIVDTPFGSTLVADATDLDGDTLTFSKVNGPAWLAIAPNGALAGTPTTADLGTNGWTIRVDDSRGGSDEATLQITVSDHVIFLTFISGP